MSLRVAIVLEDFTYDQFVVKPIIEALLHELGRPRAKVLVITEPLMGGVQAATDPKRLSDVYEAYPMADLFVLVVDRDCNPGRRAALDNLQNQAGSTRLAAENAFQEIEVWALAGVDDLPWSWSQVRDERHAKEQYFQPYSCQRGFDQLPDEGRSLLGGAAAARYDRLRQRCPEIGDLEDRVRQLLRPTT